MPLRPIEQAGANVRRRLAECRTGWIDLYLRDGTRHSAYLYDFDRERVWLCSNLTHRKPLVELEIGAIERIEVRHPLAFVVPWELHHT